MTPETTGEDAGPRASGASDGGFPIVGIGASAGGLRAIQAFFSALPARPGMAFVVVQHLSPDHESALASLVQSRTDMETVQAADQQVVEPDRVYVIPPGKHLEIGAGRLVLVEPVDRLGPPLAVDRFFASLAADAGVHAVGVVLSGTGADGAIGIERIKERAGLTMAQDPGEASHEGMPRSAIAMGLVDVVGTAEDLAETLVRVRTLSGLAAERGDEAGPAGDAGLQAVLAYLRKRAGYDFSEYKVSTVRRRLQRRIQAHGLDGVEDYLAFLQADAAEAQALLGDLLISVTEFFRDPQAFEVLEAQGIPELFEGKGPDDQVRVWVAGCATGEEAYSIAMLLVEHCDTLREPPALQVFATDIDDGALSRARAGRYAPDALAGVTPDRRARFFDEDANGFRVNRGLSEIVLFARHNVLSDPPFSRLDLIACRNVLIYLNRRVQARVFASFHYGLRPGGTLFLGGSEGSEPLTKGFVEVDKVARLYRRRDVDLGSESFFTASSGRARVRDATVRVAANPHDLTDRYGQWTLAAYAPPRLLVDERGEVTHVFGRAGDYLRDREGPVTQNASSKVLRAFRLDLRAALQRAFATGEPTDTPFHEVEAGGETRVVRLHVGRAGGPVADDGLVEVVFVELDPASVASLGAGVLGRRNESSENGAAVRLESELAGIRERLQSTIEQQETAKEELRASNEELQSTNEELQSTAEELETSKEELQSMNEELQTVNQELKNKIEELTRSNADLQNLMASTEIATLFLDRRLRVSRFTPTAAGLFNLIPSDLGRPLEHVTHQLDVDNLVELAHRVVSTQVPVVQTVPGRDGGGYVLRVLPYRTARDRFEGVVLTVTDVTELVEAREEALRRVRQQEAIAALGRFALSTPAVAAVFDRAVELIAEAIRVPLVKVLRHDAEAGVLVVEAGVGWREGAVGTATAPVGADSQGGYTLIARAPVVVPDLDTEARFVGPALLLDHGVRSGVSVPIEGLAGVPWGVLGAHAREPRAFTDVDGRFMESIAAVLSAALRRARDEATIREQYAEIEAVYATAPIGLAFLDEELRYRRINRSLAEINGASVEAHLGRTQQEVLPELASTLEPALRRVMETGQAIENIEVRGQSPADPDDERVWLCSYVPSMTAGATVGVSIVVQDITDRKRAEDAIRDSEERLRLAMRAGRLGTFRRDIQAGTIEFDARSRDLFSVPTDEPTDQAMERVHPDDRDRVEAAIARALDPADPADDYDVQHRLLVEGEPVRWLSVQGRVQFDGEGPDRRPVEMVGVALDITSVKQAELDLEEARARLALALAVGDAGTFDLDLDSGEVTHDEGAQQLLGLSPKQGLDEALLTVHPEDREAVQNRIAASTDPSAAEVSYRSVHRHLHPDGRVVWITARGVAQFEGEGENRHPVRLLGTLADISDLKEAQDAVRRRLVEIDAYFDAVPVAVAVYDCDGRYVRVNESMEGLIGTTSEVLAGGSPVDFVPALHVDANEPFLRRVLSTGEPVRDVEMRLSQPSDPDGPLHDWLLSYVPLLDDGAVRGAMLVVQDVTALKRAQAGLESLTADLEARVVMRTAEVRRLVGDLTEAERRERSRVAQILHDDLQQLLYAVQFKFEAMRGRDADAQRALLEQADDLVARAVHVTRTLTVDLSPPVLRGEGLDRTLEWLGHRMEEAYGLQVTVEKVGDVPVGKSIQVLLFQIVRELLFNVVKHAGTARATVQVGLLPDGLLRVVVADDGIGFELADPGDGEPQGFGLSSVRERIRLVGGTVAVESSSGGGTRIAIECPAAL